MTQYTLWKIKDGKEQAWRDWCNLLMTEHREESLDTLVEENLLRESCYFLPNGYLLYRHESATEKLPTNMERELNRKHFQTMDECLDRVKASDDVGYDLSV